MRDYIAQSEDASQLADEWHAAIRQVAERIGAKVEPMFARADEAEDAATDFFKYQVEVIKLCEQKDAELAAVKSQLRDLVAALREIPRETWPAECEPICNIIRALVVGRE